MKINIKKMILGKTAVLLTIGVVVNSLFSSNVLASEICVAQKVNEFSYASTIHYQVNCKKVELKTPSLLTAFLIPIPYDWGNQARKKLSTFMKDKGYVQVAKINEITSVEKFLYGYNQTGTSETSLAFSDSVLVFSKLNQNHNYCGVVQSNPQKIGANQNNTTYDFVVSCSQKLISDHLTGVTKEEFNEYMGNLGTEFIISTKYLGKEKSNSTLLIYEEII